MPKALDEAGVVLLSADIKTLADATYPANAAIASEYSSSNAYDIGDYCLYQGLLYKCNTTIAQGGEAWTTAHWTQVSVSNELFSASKLVFTNVTVANTNFTSGSGYTEYPYMAAIPLTNVTNTMIPEVVYSLNDVVENIFAPISETYNGGVYIYASDIPSISITIPTIICWNN